MAFCSIGINSTHTKPLFEVKCYMYFMYAANWSGIPQIKFNAAERRVTGRGVISTFHGCYSHIVCRSVVCALHSCTRCCGCGHRMLWILRCAVHTESLCWTWPDPHSLKGYVIQETGNGASRGIVRGSHSPCDRKKTICKYDQFLYGPGDRVGGATSWAGAGQGRYQQCTMVRMLDRSIAIFTWQPPSRWSNLCFSLVKY